MKIDRNPDYLKKFGGNVRRIRAEKNISQHDLYALTGISLSQLGRIERGEVNTTIATILTLADALKIEPKSLFDF